ncbi:MAG TPA: heavy metal-binding domain-containing protein, partial [Verrucomicrobiae bacterium]|nr:heavy metal-binding domain-containing protein [Verrucomicrobiae bacterium]
MKLKYFLTLGSLLVLIVLAITACSHDHGKEVSNSDVDYYTCTMHPSVKSHDPHAKCPICSMDLVPVRKKGAVAPAKQNAGSSAESSAMTGTNMAVEQPTEFNVPVSRQQLIGVTYAAAQ